MEDNYNEMTIAKETLRLYDPSTLFETQALEKFVSMKRNGFKMAYIVLAEKVSHDQPKILCNTFRRTDDRIYPTERPF